MQHVNTYKAPGPVGLSSWVLNKGLRGILSATISDILNVSDKWQKPPSVWKLADVTPLPKVKQVLDPKKELRRISLTPVLSKIAEDFIVLDYIKPALEEKVALNQFGKIAASFTVMTPINVVHKWLEATHGNRATVRVLLFDYRKAFDLVEHRTLYGQQAETAKYNP